VKPIISTNIRLRYSEFFVVGDDSIVDDFCYFSTKVKIGRCSHIANGCSIAGGVERLFELGDYSSLSAGVRIWCGSDDFVNDIVTIMPAGIEPVKTHFIAGDVTMGHYTAIGSNSVVMPSNHIPEGTVIGALSFVPPEFDFKPWSVYAGIPIRFICPRNQDNVMAQVERLDAFLKNRER
jgi:acetyltransferase-like isoleucine patch superfamily enzyme